MKTLVLILLLTATVTAGDNELEFVTTTVDQNINQRVLDQNPPAKTSNKTPY